MPAAARGFFSLKSFYFFLLFLIFSPFEVIFVHAIGNVTTTAAAEVEMSPLIEQGKAKMVVMLNESRRRLGSFQVCGACTCCGANGYCLPSPCCYAINCNIPNRPFGFCSFTPRTCNCFGCHI